MYGGEDGVGIGEGSPLSFWCLKCVVDVEDNPAQADGSLLPITQQSASHDCHEFHGTPDQMPAKDNFAMFSRTSHHRADHPKPQHQRSVVVQR